MTPFYFGTPQRRLFGIYTPARNASGNARAAVLCHAWGREYLHTHRSMRMLGNMLASAGVHVLRFDYFGTGDSAGDGAEGGLKAWAGDIETAVEELADTTGASRVSLVGLRLGATLAADVASKRKRDINALVLWDAILSGEDYLQELMETTTLRPAGRVPPTPRPSEAGGGYEVQGFPLTHAMTAEFRGLHLSSAIGGASRTLVVFSDTERPSRAQLQTVFPTQAIDQQSGIERIPSAPAWLEDRDTGAGAVPVRILQRIVQWFG